MVLLWIWQKLQSSLIEIQRNATLVATFLERRAKKLKEGSLHTSRASYVLDEEFTKSLRSPDWVNVLFNCIKNVERQITETLKIQSEWRKDRLKAKGKQPNWRRRSILFREMLVKNRDMSLFNSSCVMIERTYLTGKR